MNKSVKIIIGLMLITLIGLLPLAAQGVQDGTVTLKYFSGRVETVEWEDMKIAEFEAATPELKSSMNFRRMPVTS